MGMGAFIIQEMFHGSCLVLITKRSEVNRHHQCWGKNEGDFFTSMAKIGGGGGRRKIQSIQIPPPPSWLCLTKNLRLAAKP